MKSSLYTGYRQTALRVIVKFHITAGLVAKQVVVYIVLSFYAQDYKNAGLETILIFI